MSDLEPAHDAATPLDHRQRMLLDFLYQYSADCPVCSYNLHSLSRPICPECGHELTLTVGTVRLQLAWLLATLAPGFFSGIAAMFVLIPIIGRWWFGDGVFMTLMAAMDLFGWCSGLFALMLAFGMGGRLRTRFLAMPRVQQRWFAIIIWMIHIAALVGFIVIGIMFF